MRGAAGPAARANGDAWEGGDDEAIDEEVLFPDESLSWRTDGQLHPGAFFEDQVAEQQRRETEARYVCPCCNPGTVRPLSIPRKWN